LRNTSPASFSTRIFSNSARHCGQFVATSWQVKSAEY
jgi:hypothetical protein